MSGSGSRIPDTSGFIVGAGDLVVVYSALVTAFRVESGKLAVVELIFGEYACVLAMCVVIFVVLYFGVVFFAGIAVANVF